MYFMREFLISPFLKMWFFIWPKTKFSSLFDTSSKFCSISCVQFLGTDDYVQIVESLNVSVTAMFKSQWNGCALQSQDLQETMCALLVGMDWLYAFVYLLPTLMKLRIQADFESTAEKI